MFFLQPVAGILFFLIFCWLISESKKSVKPQYIISGLCIQVLLAAGILFIPFLNKFFLYISKAIMLIRDATIQGTSFVFGYLGGSPAPFDVKGNTFVFAFQALPMIIVVSALSMLLFYWKILPVFVRSIARIFRKTLNIGGALGICSAAQVFLGQTEAPLLIRPYLSNMHRSELFSVICTGFATTSATIMGLYALVLDHTVPNAIYHILTSSIISVPGALTLARIVVPPHSQTSGDLVLPFTFSGSMDAISKGTSDGIRLYINVLAMLIVFVALIFLVNKILAILPFLGGEAITLQRLLGYAMAPIAWLMGIPWSEALTAGSLLGIKTILNEFYAFTELSSITSDSLSTHSRIIMTYALCGFANISSIGIVIGGFSSLIPDRRNEIITLTIKALFVGTLASCLSGLVTGILLQMFT